MRMAVKSYPFVISVNASGPGSFPKTSKTKYNVIPLTPANLASTESAAASLATAYATLTFAVVADTGITIPVEISDGYPAGVANRGSKMIITAVDANGRLFTHTIPAFDTTGTHLNPDKSTLNLADTDVAAYVAAFNALALSPDGVALTVLRGILGGRRA